MSIGLILIATIPIEWPAIDCPSQAEVVEYSEALMGTTTASVSVRTSTLAAGVRLTFSDGTREVQRAVALSGPCDRRAATVAAVIERVVTSWYEPAEVSTIVRLPPPEPPPELVGTTTISLPPHREAWVSFGAHAAIGAGGVQGGLEAEGMYLFDHLGLGFRATYRFPRTIILSEGDVRIDEGHLAVLGIWALGALGFEAQLFLQIASGESRGISDPGQTTRVNPGVGLGARYRLYLGSDSVHLGIRARVPLVTQRFLVNGEEVGRLPPVQLEAAAAVSYDFF